MNQHRHIQITEEIQHAASEFLVRESNHASLITVTHTDLSPDLKHAMIYISVLPQKHEDDALLFIKRHVVDFREYLKKNTRFGQIPHIDFQIDEGEKNRLRIDELTARKDS